jgi:hypothetical protein
MRRFRTRSCASVVSATCLVAACAVAAQAADPAVTVDPKTPESAVMMPVQALRADDFKTTFEALPADQKAAYEDQWKNQKADPKGDADLDAMLAKLLAPGAVDTLTKEYTPTLADPSLQPARLSQIMMAMSGYLPMLMGQGQPGQQGATLVPQMQSVLADAAKWVPSAGINDPGHLHDALGHVVAGTKALGFTSAAGMRAMPLEDVLGHLGDATKEYKQAFGVYGAPVDPFLDSVKAKAEAGDGDHRTVDVSFTLFGKPYTAPVKVDRSKDGHWQTSPDNASSFGNLSMMGAMFGAGGLGGGRPVGRPGPPPGAMPPGYPGAQPQGMPPGAPPGYTGPQPTPVPPGQQAGAPAGQPSP